MAATTQVPLPMGSLMAKDASYSPKAATMRVKSGTTSQKEKAL